LGVFLERTPATSIRIDLHHIVQTDPHFPGQVMDVPNIPWP